MEGRDEILKAIDARKDHILKSFESEDDLSKGRAAQIGEVRTHAGKKVQKTANGWVPVKEGKPKKDIGAAFRPKPKEAPTKGGDKKATKELQGKLTDAQNSRRSAQRQIEYLQGSKEKKAYAGQIADEKVKIREANKTITKVSSDLQKIFKRRDSNK